MDTTLQKLKADIKPADCALWRTCKHKNWSCLPYIINSPNLILSTLKVLPEMPSLILKTRCGQIPQKYLLLIMS